MTQIFDSLIRKKVINLVYDLGSGLNELVIDIPISFEIFNSIEIYDESIILLHTFNDGLEFSTNFDDLENNDKIDIYHQLFCFL